MSRLEKSQGRSGAMGTRKNELTITKKKLIQALKAFPDDTEIHLTIGIRDIDKEVIWNSEWNGLIIRKNFIVIRNGKEIEFLSPHE